MISELGDVIQSYKRIKRAWTSDDKSTDAYLAATCLLEFPTYRLLQRNDSDPFIGFRLIYRALLRFRAEQKLTPSDSQSKAMIFGGHVEYERTPDRSEAWKHTYRHPRHNDKDDS